MFGVADQEFTQCLGGTEDPVQRLAGLRVRNGQSAQIRVLLDQPDQRLQGSVRVRRQLQPGEEGILVEPLQFPGGQEPLAFVEIIEAGGNEASGQAHRGRLQDAEVALQLVGRHLEAVVLPFRTLVPEEVLEHLLTEDLRHQFGILHGPDGVVQARRQRVVSHGPALGGVSDQMSSSAAAGSW